MEVLAIHAAPAMAIAALGIVEVGLDLAVGDNTSAAVGLLCLFPMGKGIKYVGGDAIKGGSKAKSLYKVASERVAKAIDIKNPVVDNIRTGSALKTDALHAFNDIIDNYASYAQKFPLVGGDNVTRQLYEIEGRLNGKKGIFQWIVDPDTLRGVTHRRFIEGVGITGKPNAIPKK
ncbi:MULTISPECIES: hypothetical protein [Clostridium]|uniref:hypothetical protein n=1 Tax=Clostridium TaxID=1485 RepID=UPI000773C350|nr:MULTISPECIES: hypothetical protein [Clostridium]AUM95033.1 hypothetical protein RSJ11_07700 [Clostridium sporogenes]AVQ52471.1 hypothetical protein C7M59_06240 [Clostridium botulinum]MCW6111083.1 hypothetical protein [Clostridium sporogenes]